MPELTGAPAPADTAPVPQPESTEPAPVGPDPGAQLEQPDHKAKVAQLLTDFEDRQVELQQKRAAEQAALPPPAPEGLRDGESWDEIYKDQPENVQRAMASLRAMVTRKTQDLARETRAIKGQRQALVDSGVLESLTTSANAAPEDFDPFNPQHLDKLVEAKVAQRLKEVILPLHQQNEAARNRAGFETFKDSHPDLLADPDVKSGVSKALKADGTLKLQTAYWMVKGQISHAAQKKADGVRVVRDNARRQAATMPGRGRRPQGSASTTAADMQGSAVDIYMRQLALAQRRS
jgi:malate synthase